MRILLAFPVLLALVVAEPARADDHAPVLDTLEKRLSYAVGVSIGNQLVERQPPCPAPTTKLAGSDRCDRIG